MPSYPLEPPSWLKEPLGPRFGTRVPVLPDWLVVAKGIRPDTAAAQSGLNTNAILAKINGRAIDDVPDFDHAIELLIADRSHASPLVLEVLQPTAKQVSVSIDTQLLRVRAARIHLVL